VEREPERRGAERVPPRAQEDEGRDEEEDGGGRGPPRRERRPRREGGRVDGGGASGQEAGVGGSGARGDRQGPDGRLMRLAALAAPKPLSMFTTVTPDAHEFSIPSSAASPPNAAP